MDIQESSKKVYCERYNTFLKFLGGTWEKPKYEVTKKIPFIPLESEIDQLIAGLSPMVATFCQIAKETGASKSEIVWLKWTDIDFERRIISINKTTKRHATRAIPVSDKCISMINQLPRKGHTLFTNVKSIDTNYYRQRKRIAYRLNNPRLQKIGLHTFRHWHGTMLYHKTRSIIHVQQRLGHKNIRNTMIYITIEETLFQQRSDEFYSAVAETVEEARKLIEAGFEKIDEFNGVHIYRKRK